MSSGVDGSGHLRKWNRMLDSINLSEIWFHSTDPAGQTERAMNIIPLLSINYERKQFKFSGWILNKKGEQEKAEWNIERYFFSQTGKGLLFVNYKVVSGSYWAKPAKSQNEAMALVQDGFSHVGAAVQNIVAFINDNSLWKRIIQYGICDDSKDGSTCAFIDFRRELGWVLMVYETGRK